MDSFFLFIALATTPFTLDVSPVTQRCVQVPVVYMNGDVPVASILNLSVVFVYHAFHSPVHFQISNN